MKKYLVEVFYKIEIEADKDCSAILDAAYQPPCTEGVRSLSIRIVSCKLPKTERIPEAVKPEDEIPH